MEALMRVLAIAILLSSLFAPPARAQFLGIKRIAGRILRSVADGSPAQNALFGAPAGVAVDSQQQVYVSDSTQGRVYRIDGSGKVTTLTTITAPGRLAVDGGGALYVIDGSVIVRKIAPDGTLTSYAGTGAASDSSDGQKATQTPFLGLADLAFDPQGRLCVVDQTANKVRRIEADGTVKTVAGTGVSGFKGDGGPATAAQLASPGGIAFLLSGEMLIADNSRIRKVAKDGTIGTLVGNGAPAAGSTAALSSPNSIAVSPAGDVYFLESNARLRVVPSGGTLQPALSQRGGFSALAAHPAGGVMVANASYHDISRIASPTATPTVVAGAIHFGGDGGAAVDALFDVPRAVVADAAGNFYISDSGNRRIRRVTAAGTIDTYAGTGNPGYKDGVLTAKTINFETPFGLALEPKGTLYVADYGASRIFAIGPNGGAATTVAGKGYEDGFFSARKSGPALTTAIDHPMGLCIAADGKIYIGAEHGIKRLTPAGNLEVDVGGWTANNTGGFLGFMLVNALAPDSAGNVMFSDWDQFDKVSSAGQVDWGVLDNKKGTLGTASGIAADDKDNFYYSFSLMKYIGRMAKGGALSPFAGGGSQKPADLTNADLTDLSNAQAITVLPDGNLAFIIGDSLFRTVTLMPTTLRITGGDRQKGWIGSDTPLRVALTGMSDVPVPNTKVLFAVIQGSATLSSNSAITDSAGTASVTVRLGNALGDVVIMAGGVPGVPAVTFQLSVESLLYQPPDSGVVPAVSYNISTAAGAVPDGENVPALSVRLDRPEGLVLDGAGNLFIGDRVNRKVRKVAASGSVATYAPGAGWSAPSSLALDADGTLYALDGGNVRAVGPDGKVRTLPGSFSGAASIAADQMARVYVAEPEAHRVRVIFPEGAVGVFAGEGAPDRAAGLITPTQVVVAGDFTAYIGDPGARTVWQVSPTDTKTALVGGDAGARLDQLVALALDARGTLYLAERGGAIYRVSADGALTAFATAPDEIAAMAFSPDGKLYAISAASEQVRVLDSSGTWKTVAGAPHFSGDGGPATAAGLNRPRGVAAAPDGGYYIADTDNGRVRLVDASGTIGTVAGGGDQTPPQDGSPVKATAARFTPLSVLAAPEGGFYINAGTQILFAGTDGALRALPTPDTLHADGAMALDSSGRLMVADRGNHRVIRLSADGTLETLAGNGTAANGADGAPAASSAIQDPRAVAVDARGLVYIACGDRIRRIEADGALLTLPGANVDTAAIAFDDAGGLFVAEPHRVRRIAPPSAPAVITGAAAPGFSGDGGPASQGRLNAPSGLLVPPTGEILLADTLNHRIRRLR